MIFWRSFFLKKFFFISSMAIERFFSVISAKLVGPVVSTAFCLSFYPVCGEKNLSKTFFSHQFRTLIADWSVLVQIFSGQVDDTAFFGSNGSVLRHKTVLTKLCFVYHLRPLSEKIMVFFSGTQSAGLSKLLTMGSVEQIFLWIGFFCSSLGLERSFLRDFDKKFSLVSTKLLSVCPLQQFVMKIFLSKYFSPIFLGYSAKIYRSYFKTFSVKSTKLHSTSPKDQFEDLK